MVDETGCKISECAGDHDHTWQKQPEALLAHGVEPWSIGLKDHNDRHMPQVDSVLVSRHEVQWAKNPEIHFRQDGKAHEQYSKQNRKNGMSRITSRSRSVKAVAVIVKNPCQDQYGTCERNRKSKCKTLFLYTVSGMFPECGSRHAQYKIIQCGEYLTLIYEIYGGIGNSGSMEIPDNCKPADNGKQNGHNGRYKPVFPDGFIKERGDQIKLKDHTHRPQCSIDGTVCHRGKILRKGVIGKDMPKPFIAEHLC